MRLLAVLTVFFIHSLSLWGFEYGLKPQKINSSVYCFFGKPQAIDTHNNGNMVNTCYVDMGESYLVIDSGPTYAYAHEAYTKMQSIKKQPVAYVINTHFHDDHWLGNSFYKELGIDIIGSTKFKTQVKAEVTRMQRLVSKEAYTKTKQVFPNLFVDKEKTLIINNKKVIIKDVNKKAHTSSDLFVYIPDIQTLFAGDLDFNDRILSIRDGNVEGWIAAIDELRTYKAQYIIGGHGKKTDARSLDETYRYLVELRDQVKKAIDNGVDIEDAVNEITMPEFKNLYMYDLLQRQNVETVYRTLEWEQ